MSEYVDRFTKSGRSIANDIYHGVENGEIKLIATEISDGRRLDEMAYKYYGNGLNSWIIAAASGIRWQLGIGKGSFGTNPDNDEEIVIFIPDINDIKKLKNQ